MPKRRAETKSKASYGVAVQKQPWLTELIFSEQKWPTNRTEWKASFARLGFSVELLILISRTCKAGHQLIRSFLPVTKYPRCHVCYVSFSYRESCEQGVFPEQSGLPFAYCRDCMDPAKGGPFIGQSGFLPVTKGAFQELCQVEGIGSNGARKILLFPNGRDSHRIIGGVIDELQLLKADAESSTVISTKKFWMDLVEGVIQLVRKGLRINAHPDLISLLKRRPHAGGKECAKNEITALRELARKALVPPGAGKTLSGPGVRKEMLTILENLRELFRDFQWVFTFYGKPDSQVVADHIEYVELAKVLTPEEMVKWNVVAGDCVKLEDALTFISDNNTGGVKSQLCHEPLIPRWRFVEWAINKFVNTKVFIPPNTTQSTVVFRWVHFNSNSNHGYWKGYDLSSLQQ